MFSQSSPTTPRSRQLLSPPHGSLRTTRSQTRTQQTLSQQSPTVQRSQTSQSLLLSQNTLSDNERKQLQNSFVIKGQCITFNVDYQKDFDRYFETSRWAFTNNSRGKPIKIRWGSKKKAEVWSEYFEGIRIRDGEPRVICRRCNTHIQHPGLGNGNKGIEGHVGSRQCRAASERLGLPQRGIREAFRASVSSKTATRLPHLFNNSSVSGNEMKMTLSADRILTRVVGRSTKST